MDGIREVKIRHDRHGHPKSVTVRFGPHHYLAVRVRGTQVSVTLGATHHGFTADASIPGGELDDVIERIRGLFPAQAEDRGIRM